MQSEEIFHVIKPGILTTFQDMGRAGYQRYGIPVSGAMDPFALQVANIIVGNQRNTVCLEVTFVGPQLEALTPITVAITGADLEPKVNGNKQQMWMSFHMKKGDQLSFGKHRSGVRAYIAVSGGYDAPSFFDSMSTDIKSGFGTALETTEALRSFPLVAESGIGLKKELIPAYEKVVDAAVVEGPHTDAFTKKGREMFFKTTQIVQPNSNRMGYRLKTEKIELKEEADIWSDAVPYGGIQVPRDGQPIILMADRQTTGGYPRIGTVISTDLPKLVPQGEIRFHPITIEAAQLRTIQMESFLCKLAKFRKHM